MKRVNDEEMQTMLEKGQTKRAIANHFGVSEQYIGKRLKQIEAYRLPESVQKLTDKQKRYALARVEGKSKTDSAMEAYDTKDKDSAKALGYTLSKDPDINTAIHDLLAQEGISRRRRIQRLRDMIECSDMNIVGKGLDMANKMAGEYAPLQVDMTLTDEMIVKWIDCAVEMAKANAIEIEDNTADKN